MNPRTTGILFIVALALGAFIWFYEIEGEAGRKQAEERSKQLFGDVEAGDVDWITLTTTDGKKVRAERRDGGWTLVEPLAFPADAFALDAIASALADVTSVAVYEDPQAPEVYGLDDESALEVDFGAKGAEYSLRAGKQAPVGGNSYVSIPGDDAVYTVSTVKTNALKKSFDDLREKRLLVFDADAVQSFTARWPGGRVELVREGDGWKTTAPVEGPADDRTVADLLSTLTFLRAVGFQDKPRSDQAVGLVDPAFAIELRLAPGEDGGEARTLSLEIGSVELDGVLHARTDKPSLYWIDPARLDSLPREVDAYRFKQLSQFDASAAKRVDMAFESEKAGQTYAVTLTSGEDGWTSSPDPVAPEKIRQIVDTLSDLEAQRILAEEVGPEELVGFGLSPARATFVVRDGSDTVLAEVRLGEIRGSDGVVAQTGDNPQVFEIPLDHAEHLPVTLEAFRNRFVTQPEPAGDSAGSSEPTAPAE